MKSYHHRDLTNVERQEIQTFLFDCRGVCAEWDDWFDTLSDIEKLDVLRKTKANCEVWHHGP